LEVNLRQGRSTQVGIWAANPRNLGRLRKNVQNTDFSLNSESSLGRTKIFLGRRLDVPDLNPPSKIFNKPEIDPPYYITNFFRPKKIIQKFH
jgi:hypothetical protein